MNGEQRTAAKQSCFGSCAIVFVLFVLLTVVDFVPLIRMGIDREQRIRTQTVGKDIPRLFPVVVVSPSDGGGLQAAIVFHENLEEYRKAHPASSFVVPMDKVTELNAQIKKYSYDSGYGVGKFSVSALPNGRQAFEVSGTWDDDRVNIGWYEADSKGFSPKRHVWFFAPGLVMTYFLLVLMLNAVVAVTVVLLRLMVISRLGRRSTGTESA